MDSNLSLLEIADEDDSLLLQVPKDSPSSIFSCSPLQCLKSLPSQTEFTERVVPPENSSSSPKDDMSKVNINGNKTEAPKLSIEPQQMKRRKKGGGYNLRKSLAWNRAFFTEEGVLDPLELSMISGNHSITNTELSVIHEEEPDTLVDKANTITASPGLRAFEEELSKEMLESSSIELRKIGACSSPKPRALNIDTRGPPSLAKRKVLAVNDINRCRSKRNVCPRPGASSSLKRNDTQKEPIKESKVSRLPVLKSNAPVIASTVRSGALSTSHSNRNQNSHPTTNIQKNAAVKGESRIPGSLLSNTKFDLADKHSVTRTFSRKAGKNTDNSVSQMHPPSRLQHQQVNEGNKGSNPYGHPPQSVYIAGEKKQQSQFQATKPSGLRMPSPSLGFFSQPKASGSHSLQQKSSKSCKPAEKNIPKSRIAGANSVNETRPAHSSLKSSDIVNDAAKKCTLKPSLLEISLRVETNQSSKVDVQCCSLGYEELTKREKDKKTLDYAHRNSEEQEEPYKIESVSDMGDTEFEIENEKLLSQIHTHKQSEKETDCHLEDNLFMSNKDLLVFQGRQSIDHCSMQRIPIRKDNLSNIMNNAMTCDEDEQIRPLTCNIQASDASLVLQGRQDSSSSDLHSGQVKNCNSVKIMNVDPSFDKHGGYVQVNFLNGNLSVDCNDTTQNISVAVNQHDVEENLGEKIETSIPSIGGDVLLETDNESDMNSCLIHKATLSSQESFDLSLPDINGVCRSKSKIAEMEDCQHPADDQVASVHRRPVDDIFDQLIDSEMTNDRAQANSLELGRMCEDNQNVSASACNTEVSNLSVSLEVHQNDMDENCVEQSDTPDPSSVEGNLLKGDHESKIDTCPVHVTTLSSQGSHEKPLQDINGSGRSESEIVEMEDCRHPEDGQPCLDLELNRICEDSLKVFASACSTEVSTLSISRAVYQNDMDKNRVEQSETPNPSSVGGGNFLKGDHAPKIGACLVHVTPSSSQGSPEKPLQDINGGCRSESEIVEMEDCQHSGDGQSCFDLELNRMCEDSISESATACRTEVRNPSLGSGHFYENNVEYPYYTSQPCQFVLDNCSPRGNNLLLDKWCTISKLHSREDSSSGDTSMHFDSMCVQNDDQRNSKQETGLLTSSETTETLCENESSVANQCKLPDGSECFEVSDINSIIEVPTVSVAEGSSGLFRNKPFVQTVRESDYPSRVIEKLHVEDAYVQSSDENLVAYKCGNNPNTSVASDHASLAVDNVDEKSHLPELQKGSLVSADINSVSEVSTASVAASSSGLIQHEPLVQSVTDTDHPKRMIEKLHVEDAYVQFSDENLVAYKCSNNPNTSVARGHFSLAVENVNEHCHLLELQKPSLVIAVDSQHVSNNFHLNGDLLLAGSEEIKKESLSDGALEPCSDYNYANENNTSNSHIQAIPETDDGSPDVNGKAALLQMDGADKDSAEMLPSVEAEFNNSSIAAEIVPSIKGSEDQIVEVVDRKADEHCPLSESSDLLVADNLISNERSPQCGEVGSMNSGSSSEKAEPSICEKVEFSNAEIQHQIKTDDCSAEDSSKIVHLGSNKSEIKSKRDVPTVKPPPNAAPFSDEWLAAIEAAGEEVLSMKGGAVQNSPPDKPHHEPGPWSPVRRKNQAVGPHDCTKYTNIPHTNSP